MGTRALIRFHGAAVDDSWEGKRRPLTLRKMWDGHPSGVARILEKIQTMYFEAGDEAPELKRRGLAVATLMVDPTTYLEFDKDYPDCDFHFDFYGDGRVVFSDANTEMKYKSHEAFIEDMRAGDHDQSPSIWIIG